MENLSTRDHVCDMIIITTPYRSLASQHLNRRTFKPAIKEVFTSGHCSNASSMAEIIHQS